jgi:hypothetical protein
VVEHNRQLFLLLLEECRSNMSTMASKQPQQGYQTNNKTNNNNSRGKDLKWQRGEVKTITSNLRDCLSTPSPSSSSSSSASSATRGGDGAVDPRLGSLWMLQVQLLPPKRARSESDLSTASNSTTSDLYTGGSSASASATGNGSGDVSMIEGYRPGELLVCRNQVWGNR